MTDDKIEPTYPPLKHETRYTLPTNNAAFHFGRSSQTLRVWACYENGPIKPLRINGRLAWPVAEMKRLLGVDENE